MDYRITNAVPRSNHFMMTDLKNFAKQLSESAEKPQSLDLSGCTGITKKGLECLKGASFEKLTSLDLSGCWELGSEMLPLGKKDDDLTKSGDSFKELKDFLEIE